MSTSASADHGALVHRWAHGFVTAWHPALLPLIDDPADPVICLGQGLLEAVEHASELQGEDRVAAAALLASVLT